MYFWNIKALKEDITAGSFTDKELIPYMVLFLGLYAVGAEIVIYLKVEDVDVNNWTYVLSTLNVLIPIVGIIYAYRCNGGAEGKNLASKYFSMGFVVGIRFLIYLIPVMILLMIYWAAVFQDQEALPTTLFEVALFSTWHGLLYFKLAKHIGDTAKPR